MINFVTISSKQLLSLCEKCLENLNKWRDKEIKLLVDEIYEEKSKAWWRRLFRIKYTRQDAREYLGSVHLGIYFDRLYKIHHRNWELEEQVEDLFNLLSSKRNVELEGKFYINVRVARFIFEWS